ncbi:MAG: TlpA disulfide reductase family protein [Spirochaetales bacterium]
MKIETGRTLCRSLLMLLLLASALFTFAGGGQESQAVPSERAQTQVESGETGDEPALDETTVALLEGMGVLPLESRVQSENFSLPALDVETLSLTEALGQVVLVNFWGTWCPPCREEMPSMQILYDEFAESGLEMLAVNVLESREVAAAFIDEFGFTYPVLLDRDGRVGLTYGVRGYPTTYIIDREGFIIGVKMGFHDWSTPEVLENMRALLEQGA